MNKFVPFNHIEEGEYFYGLPGLQLMMKIPHGYTKAWQGNPFNAINMEEYPSGTYTAHWDPALKTHIFTPIPVTIGTAHYFEDTECVVTFDKET